MDIIESGSLSDFWNKIKEEVNQKIEQIKRKKTELPQ